MSTDFRSQVRERADRIAKFGGIAPAVSGGGLEQFQRLSVSEALVLGLLNQGVCKYVGIFGHGNTDIADILSFYEEAGLVRVFNVRHEVEASHCATMLRWHYGETTAVMASIGPGALHALAGSLAASSNGIGVYHIYGDETTQDEGPNMQQIPKPEQAGFLSLVKTMGQGYLVHTPLAIFTALRRGASTVFNPYFAGPFYFLMPMNIQPVLIDRFNLLELPEKPLFPRIASADDEAFEPATEAVQGAKAITIKFGGGAVHCGPEIQELADLIDAVIVSGARMSGVVPYSFRRYMSVGGSKGSLCGNYAMNHADLSIIIGARAVCQWDCSGTAWKTAKRVINFNTDPYHINQYNRSVLILGDAKPNLKKWISQLRKKGLREHCEESQWLTVNRNNKRKWEELKRVRIQAPVLFDRTWGKEVLTQPAAIRIASEFARQQGAACYFDSGDVQANGFQILEDAQYGLTFNETGSSYMGFAVSALLAAAVADHPVYTFAFSGDGSFTMNPQILFDGVQNGVKACILLFDNRSMAAITGLQKAQYHKEFKTADKVVTDYVALARSVQGVKGIYGGHSPREFHKALQEAYKHEGLSLIHLPVYLGDDDLGGLGVFGSWNVGNWCAEVQKEHHRIGL